MKNRPSTEYTYQEKRKKHWNTLAGRNQGQSYLGGYYKDRLIAIYRFLIAPGQRVLELGCGTGNLLAALKPSYGVGIDFSTEMVRLAKAKHPDLVFLEHEVHDIEFTEKFDAVILSDLVNDLWDVQRVFKEIAKVSTPKTLIIINCYSRVWQLPLDLVRGLGFATPLLPQNWLTIEDVSDLLQISDFSVIRSWQEILWPIRTPVLDFLFNRFLVRLWPFYYLGLTNFLIARPKPSPAPGAQEPMVSIIIPARNEEGHITEIFKRVPEMGRKTELIFVEGHSRDQTFEAIQEAIRTNPNIHASLYRQQGEGKNDAVRLGFSKASGDILMILDADLTVPPEDLPRFYEILVSRKADLANGVRFVYPMEKKAMRFFNILGNKFFSLAFSWILGQPIKDTLCGTKALWKKDYERITANQAYFGDFDPFGDFNLLFGAAKLNMHIISVPIRYRERSYGATNISRWSHGAILLRFVFFGAKRLKFF